MDILYTDKYIAVCIKEAGRSSQDDGTEECVPAMLRTAEHTDGIFPVHRLDKEVSGLMVYAKNKFAAGELSGQITDGRFTKTYYALVSENPEFQQGRMDDLLFHDASKNKSYVVRRIRKGVRDASLLYETIGCGRLGEKPLRLMKICLITGRTHQIRVQFSSRSMPLVGDRKYGGIAYPSICLLSAGLDFYHPKTGEPMHFELPVPEAYKEVLQNE